MKGMETSGELVVRSKTLCRKKKKLCEWVEKEKFHCSRPHKVESSAL